MQPVRSRGELTQVVKAMARAAGFAAVGVADVRAPLRPDLFGQWLERGWAGQMDYMARHVERRCRPALLVEGARNVICLAVGYAPAGEGGGLIARYARGRDYHKLLKRRCHKLMDRLREMESTFEGRAFVDSGPIPERSLAAAAGVGWIGRNGCLFVPGLGSYVLLCEIVCNLDLVPDTPIDSRCTGCDKCIRACPTGAIADPPLMDSTRCISYLTIEHEEEIPEELWLKIGHRVFGCDACQEACPHNRGVPAGDAEFLSPTQGDLGEKSLAEILAWSPEDWDAATRGSAARRARHAMWIRNAKIASL